MKNLDLSLEELINAHVELVKENAISIEEALKLAEAEKLKDQCTLRLGINFIKVTQVTFTEDTISIRFINCSNTKAGEQVLYKETFNVGEQIYRIDYLKDSVAEALNINGFADTVTKERDRRYPLAGPVSRAKGIDFSDAYMELLNNEDFPHFEEVGTFTPNKIIPVWSYRKDEGESKGTGYWVNCFKPTTIAKHYCEARGWVLKQPQQVEYLKKLTDMAIAQING